MQEGISKSATDNIRAGMTLGLMPLHLNTFISTFYYYWQSIGSSNSMNLVAKAEISRLKRTQVSVRGWCGILVDESHLKLSSDLHPSFLTFVTSCLMKRGLHHLHSWWFPRCSHCILSLSGRHGFHGSTSSRAEWGLSFPGHSSLPVPSPAPGRCPGCPVAVGVQAVLLQEGAVPGSRRALCVEEVEALLEHLVEHKNGLGLLELVTLHHLLGKTEAFSVLQTGVRGESAHLAQEPEGSAWNQHVVLRQITAQRSSQAVADQHQGHQ